MMNSNEEHYNKAIYTALRIGFIALLFVWSFEIIKPFILPVLWGIIISVALYPMFKKLAKLFGGREKLASSLITILALSLLIIPSVLFVESTISGIQNLASQMGNGDIQIPLPDKSVSEWPLIGGKIYEIWLLASQSLEALLTKFSAELMAFAPSVLSFAGGFSTTILLFIISIIIAGALLTKAEASEKAAKSIFNTLIGEKGEGFVTLSVSIIRSVVQGVLGVAVIQSFLGGIGIWIIGIPMPGLWALIILFLAILQLPPLLILGPLAIYVFSFANTTPAVLFLIWSLLVSASDAFLKPLLLGRGVDVPMLAILLGAIGGMMMSGIIGLFVGAVVLALSYKVFQALLVDDVLEKSDENTVVAE